MKNFFKFYVFLEKIWFKFPQKIRFLLVGGFNTVFSYALLNFLNYIFKEFFKEASEIIIANGALFLQYIICINWSFYSMRYYVFQSRNNWRKEWIKSLSVYLFMYFINAPILSFLIIKLGWAIWLAQGVYLIFATTLIFLLHKYFSFRKF